MLTSDSPPKARLDQISTCWESIHDPGRFVLRYAPAIARFLRVLVRSPQDAEDICQEFMVGVITRGLPPAADVHGRFRNYLIAAVRNAARAFYRRRPPDFKPMPDLDQIPDTRQPELDIEREWLKSWRQCLLDRVWEALENHQHKSPGNLYYLVLRQAAEHPEEDSKTLAARVRAQTKRGLRPEAFRKQLSRARRKFAALLVEEVSRTLALPDPRAIKEELAELGLMAYVKEILPTI